MIAGEFNDYNITEKKHLDRQLEEKRNNSNPLKRKTNCLSTQLLETGFIAKVN